MSLNPASMTGIYLSMMRKKITPSIFRITPGNALMIKFCFQNEPLPEWAIWPNIYIMSSAEEGVMVKSLLQSITTCSDPDGEPVWIDCGDVQLIDPVCVY